MLPKYVMGNIILGENLFCFEAKSDISKAFGPTLLRPKPFCLYTKVGYESYKNLKKWRQGVLGSVQICNSPPLRPK